MKPKLIENTNLKGVNNQKALTIHVPSFDCFFFPIKFFFNGKIMILMQCNCFTSIFLLRETTQHAVIVTAYVTLLSFLLFFFT